MDGGSGSGGTVAADAGSSGSGSSSGGGSSGAPPSWSCALPGLQGFASQVTWAVGPSPAAVAIADLDLDGRPDLLVANGGYVTVSVLLNSGERQGAGSFAPQLTFAVGLNPDSLVVADFNGDGLPDLAVANQGTPGGVASTVSVLLNGGGWQTDGGFAPQIGFQVGTDPRSIAAGDLNGDGLVDLAVVNACGLPDGGHCPGSVSVLLNEGYGSFAPQLTYAVTGQPLALAVGDLDGDGLPELAVASGCSLPDGGSCPGTLTLLSDFLPDADGGIAPVQTFLSVGRGPQALALADFDGDGKLDLAVADADDGTVGVMLNEGGGTFGVAVTYAVGRSPCSLAVGDFDRDGRPDLAVANHDAPADGVYTVSVLLNQGGGAFGSQLTFSVGASPVAVAAADLTGDGRLDLAVANSGENAVGTLLNVAGGQGTGTLGAPEVLDAGDSPDAVAVGDFDGDGRLDLAVANGGDSWVSVLLNTGAGPDGGFAAQVTYAVGNSPSGVAAADFNGDGLSDLAVTNAADNTVSVLLSQADGGFGPQALSVVADGPSSLAVADFNGDGWLDLAVTSADEASVCVLLNYDAGAFPEWAYYCPQVGEGPLSLVAADFNGDGKPDLAVANSVEDSAGILINDGYGYFFDQVTFAVGKTPMALAVGDFNGDGQPDLAVANSGDDTVGVLLNLGTSLGMNLGDGGFSAQTTYAVGRSPQAVIARDLNGDGRLDLAVANAGDGTVSVLLGDGDGGFAAQVTFAAGDDPVAMASGDFTGNGQPDLAVVGSTDGTVDVLAGSCQ